MSCAVFINNNNIVTSWLPNVESEEDLFGLNYVLFDELPLEITNNINGDLLVIDKETKEITLLPVEPEPEPEPTPEQIKIAQLEAENILLRERDSQIQDDNNFILEILINAGLL